MQSCYLSRHLCYRREVLQQAMTVQATCSKCFVKVIFKSFKFAVKLYLVIFNLQSSFKFAVKLYLVVVQIALSVIMYNVRLCVVCVRLGFSVALARNTAFYVNANNTQQRCYIVWLLSVCPVTRHLCT